MRKTFYCIAAAALLAFSCTEKGGITSIEGRNIIVENNCSQHGATKTRAVIENRRHAIDSIKSPIIGEAAITLTVQAPESTLMNFAADALLNEAKRHTNKNIDVAITNKGGLRSELNAGTITFGDIYNVFPFENTLTLLTLNGAQLMTLFNEIAAQGGEAVSGARLIISPDGKLLNASVNGKPVVPSKNYTIATSDYLSQGNDGLHTLKEGTEREGFAVSIRDMMIEHIARLHKDGKAIEATIDGRITIKE